MNDASLRSVVPPGQLWQRDQALCAAAEVLDRLGHGGIRAVSFDFFDTIVWRLVRKPTDLFTEVGTRLAARDMFYKPESQNDYETLRRHAEYKARERQILSDPKQEDINLAAICANLKAIVKDPAVAAQIEREVETEFCLLNPGMVDFIHYVRSRGLRVLIISDIYFPASQLRDILAANHLDPALFEFVLTSCDAGVCKRTGNLFKRALRDLGLKPNQLLHVGDDYEADVVGGRKAGVRTCHYPSVRSELETIIEREQFLLGGQSPTFSVNSLRLLAARYFGEETIDGFFSRSGAMLMGPIMTQFAAWACEQYVNSGVRKVGAFMREGDLFGRMLQREAEAKGYDLDVKPLFVNRKSTALAEVGKLTAEGLMKWLRFRGTLPMREILLQLGLDGKEFRKLPFPLTEKADTTERIIKLAEFLFSSEIARRIEAASAAERSKFMDYLRPWLSPGGTLGLCDLGYNGSALAQLHRILSLEGDSTKLVGCFMVTYEQAADRVLEGMDIRHFLGSFGKPDFFYRAFVRSPAFIEQSIVAPIGTTLGYERQADGSVTPILDQVPFSPETLRTQKAFKDGILFYQDLWLKFCAAKPKVLAGGSELSHRILGELKVGLQPILARATAFPLAAEAAHFGNLPLDDYFFADKFRTLCGPKDRDFLRQQGYPNLLNEGGTHWPHATYALENPKYAPEFFSYANALLLCNPEQEYDGPPVELTVYVRSVRNPAHLRECLSRVRTGANPKLCMELQVRLPASSPALAEVAREFSTQFARFSFGEMLASDTVNKYTNLAVDDFSTAPFVLCLQEDAYLPAGWDKWLLDPLRADPAIGAAIPLLQVADATVNDPSARCLLFRRTAFIEGLGFNEQLSPDGAAWNMTLQLDEQKWKVLPCPDAVVEIQSPLKKQGLPTSDADFLKQKWPDYEKRMAALTRNSASPLLPSPVLPSTECLSVNWVGPHLDYGSLAHVNRECLRTLKKAGGFDFNSKNPRVTVRHQWPPDWSRLKQGALVIIQPWEFGALPKQWVNDAAHVDEFWVPSNYVRQVYVDSGISGDKVFVIPNGVDQDHYRPGIEPLALATAKKFRFLFVGGTIPRKGPDVLLHAYLQAFTAADDVCLVIKDFGGQSVYRGQTFEKEIAAAKLRPNAPEILYLNSKLPPSDMPRLYAACHCLVHPYRGEGFGMPVLEAMACGLPVVVTRGGATDDFVSADAGWFIQASRRSIGPMVGAMPLVADGWCLEPDIHDLVTKLKFVLANPEEAQKRGSLGAIKARQDYSWDLVAQKMKERLLHVATIERPASPVSVHKAPLKIELPPTALLGHLVAAREALKQRQSRKAWELAAEALKTRPFHPEAWLILAESARLAGAAAQCTGCLEQARQMVPNWKPGRQFKAPRHAGHASSDWPSIPTTTNPPRLSVCLIVKNEEQFLEQCLQSVRDIAHQIVVVDTGSTDGTIEIAKKFNAEIHSLAWTDDFSAARNEALKYATGDWILSLDADEELMAEHKTTILEEMRSAQVMGYRLPIFNVGQEKEGCGYVPRLFRNAPGLFFVGRVHEEIFSSLEARATEWGLELSLGRSALLHRGYRDEVVVSRGKVARNLRLIQIALEEIPDSPSLVMNLGLELIRSGQFEAGLSKYFEAVRLISLLPSGKVTPEFSESLLTQLTTNLLGAARYKEIVEFWRQPFPKSCGMTASQHFMLGMAHLELKEFAQAAEQMRQCLAKRTAPALSPINKHILTVFPRHLLALCLGTLEQRAEAEQAFQEALQEDNKSRVVRFDFARFQFKNGRAIEALKLVNQLVAEDPNDLPTWQLGGTVALSQPDFLDFARTWTGEAIKNFPIDTSLMLQRAEALLLNQQVELALPIWVQAHSPNSSRHLAAVILCELLEGGCQRELAPAQEKLASQEFLKWYRHLIKCKAHSVVNHINEKLDDLRRVLPSAAAALDAAMKQAVAVAV